MGVQAQPTEYHVKAAFIYNFAKFIDWPDEDSTDQATPIIIEILGEDPFGDILDETMAGKTVRGREIEIRRSEALDLGSLRHILFVSTSRASELGPIKKALDDRPVLTVGDCDGFAAAGGTIGFVEEAGRVRFEVNMARVVQTGLRVSSKLLKVARVVHEDENAGESR
jgi:hypothetical protein